MFTKSTYVRKVTRAVADGGSSSQVTDRQELLPGFNQQAIASSRVVMIGAGGIGSEIGEGLTRKGIGALDVFDHDFVEVTNLNRQLYFKRDLGKRKGCRLALNLAAHAVCGSVIQGYGESFEDAVAAGRDLRGQVAICGVDNGETRINVSRYFGIRDTPVAFIAVDYLAECGYVFVQEPGKACFGCAFPNTYQGRKAPCRTPAVKDILKTVAGLALYAVDTILMDRQRNWNYRDIHLAGFAPSQELRIEKLADCPLCGSRSEGGAEV